MKRMRLVLWFVVFGLLPFWVSLVYVVLGSRGRSPEYWAAAPWLVIAAVPLCAVTLVMASITYAVYAATAGDTSRKIKYASGCFAALSAIVLMGVGSFMNHRATKEEHKKKVQEAGQALVERSALVASVAPAGFRVGLSSSQFDGRGELRRLTYYVYSIDDLTRSVMAIVDVARSTAEPQLSVACVLPERDYKKLQAGSDPCKASNAISSQ
jgi:hypothetical protein